MIQSLATHWSELITTCSFLDITSFTCILILYGLSCKKIFWDLKNVSWISPRNWLGWICRHPVMWPRQTLPQRGYLWSYAWDDSDVISMPAGFRRHLVGKTLINVCCCDLAAIRFVGKLMIMDIFINQPIEFYLDDTINPLPLASRIMPCYTHKMAIVSWPP